MKINLKNHYKLYYAKRQNIDVDWCHSSFLDAEHMHAVTSSRQMMLVDSIIDKSVMKW